MGPLAYLILTKVFLLIAIATSLFTATGGLYVAIIGFSMAGWGYYWAKFFENT